ncbi:MAG: hypothetical protein JRJ12_16060 [Deltaproteobacteria bacterium]|nr:hypothetical protein [Deltaproteobacteria bacterium]MBW2139181.1 hypothetical protein [Deltaproteobacteria bacterium]
MSQAKGGMNKVQWSGKVVAVQPRIRLTRSFDERYHSYLGYVLCIDGTCGDEAGEFRIAIGKAAQRRHKFRIGMKVGGSSVPVPDPRLETAGFYKTSGLKVLQVGEGKASADPPLHGAPPDLETYRSRGHRRLDVRTYEAKCSTCIWGCRMPVEMIIDHWNPYKKRYRFETFCYGPKSCSFYRAGPRRKVPGRKGMSYTEEDWVDEDATAHRGSDD